MSAAPKLIHDPAGRVVALLESGGWEPRANGPNAWESRCPAHRSEKRKNLAVKRADDGRVLLCCHHEPPCEAADVAAALGLDMRDLFPPKPGAQAKKGKAKGGGKPWSSLDGARKWLAGKLSAAVGPTWEYKDAAGNVVGAIVRYNLLDGGKTYRPFHAVPGGWKMGDPKGGFPLYRIDKIPAGVPIWYLEGEKVADLAASFGLAATTTAHGAQSPHKTAHGPAAGREVFIVPDNDEPGERYADALGKLLGSLSPPVVPRIVRLPDLKDEGDDLSEWVALRRSQGKADAEIRAELDALAASAPEWTPPAVPDLSIPWIDVARPDDPFTMAMLHMAGHRHHGAQTLRFHRGEFLRWDGAAWRSVDDGEISAKVGLTVHDALMRYNATEMKESAWKKADRKTIGDAVGALKSLTILDGEVAAPAWLADDPPFPAAEVLPTRNALVHLPSFIRGGEAVLPPTPDFFCTYALGYDFDEKAAAPVEWLKFLDSVLPGDQEAIDALQEWFGYCLTPDTSQQKILVMIGKLRSGKGTIARILKALIGPENVAAPTLSQMTTNFGMSSLIGKPVGIIGDARLSGRSDQSVVVERLLSISGEDDIDIDRKNRDIWTGKLPTRIAILSNEAPKLMDASGALVARMIVLRFTQSFYGREDTGLTDRLRGELPGILLWAIEGWRRLNARGRFVQPASGAALVQMLNDLSSPVSQFIRERCDVGPSLETVTSDLYAAWEAWCDDNGRDYRGTKQSFGRDLDAAVGIQASAPTTRPGYPKPVRIYKGIGIRPGF